MTQTNAIPEFLPNYSGWLTYLADGKPKSATLEEMQTWVQPEQVWETPTGQRLTVRRIYTDKWRGQLCAEFTNNEWSPVQSLLRNGKLVENAI
jgi:NADH:ubiquinone oxidoreductase subunit